MTTFASEEDLDRFRAAFESGTLPKRDWTHVAHVAIAGVYVWDNPATALPRVRCGIKRLNERHGTQNTATSGYHETLTVFWVSVVIAYCREHRQDGRLAAITAMAERLPSRLFQQYYGFDVVGSTLARAAWIPPDLQPLP